MVLHEKEVLVAELRFFVGRFPPPVSSQAKEFLTLTRMHMGAIAERVPMAEASGTTLKQYPQCLNCTIYIGLELILRVQQN